MNKRASIPVRAGLGGLAVLLALPSAVAAQDAWTAPASADASTNPFEPTTAVIREGATLYAVYCVSCHDKNGFGKGALGRDLPVPPSSFYDEAVTTQTDGALHWKISEGRGPMPGFGAALSEEERWALVTYIRQFASGSNSTASAAEVLSPADYAIDTSLTSAYFPVPKTILNVSASEDQYLMVDTVVRGLERPWGMAFLPDSSVLITQRNGTLVRVAGGTVLGPVGGNVPTGLRDVVLHPRFATNRLVYLTYYIEPTRDPAPPDGGYTVLYRGRLVDNALVDGEELYRAGPFREGGGTYGSRIAFDDDGFLYMTVGQRTIDDRHRWLTVQDKTNPSGKVLRFRDDGTIPEDNPFFQTYGALPEIYTLGHRQPQGLIRHPLTGDIWESEHGEFGGTEVNLLRSGRNYGWPEVTYSLNYDGSIISRDTARAGMEPPMHYWVPSIAPSNFDFVTSKLYPKWYGNLLIGAMVQGRLVRTVFDGDGKAVHNEYLLEDIGRVRDVKAAPDGFLYLLIEEPVGALVRLIPVTRNQTGSR